MPLYEYRCTSCGVRFERLLRATTASSGEAGRPPVACPECASEEVRRLLSAFARTAPTCDPLPSGGG